jgi:hypothetical protein
MCGIFGWCFVPVFLIGGLLLMIGSTCMTEEQMETLVKWMGV